jgi:hypothetical protein
VSAKALEQFQSVEEFNETLNRRTPPYVGLPYIIAPTTYPKVTHGSIRISIAHPFAGHLFMWRTKIDWLNLETNTSIGILSRAYFINLPEVLDDILVELPKRDRQK